MSEIGMTKDGHIKREIVSVRCALSLTVALEAYENLSDYNFSKNHDEFSKLFESKYDKSICTESDNTIEIFFYIEKVGVRGGGIKFTLDRDSYKVINTTVER